MLQTDCLVAFARLLRYTCKFDYTYCIFCHILFSIVLTEENTATHKKIPKKWRRKDLVFSLQVSCNDHFQYRRPQRTQGLPKQILLPQGVIKCHTLFGGIKQQIYGNIEGISLKIIVNEVWVDVIFHGPLVIFGYNF